MPTSNLDPDYELPPWAVGDYSGSIGTTEWSGLPRRVATDIVTFAATGLTPDERTRAESFNEWLARAQELIDLLRGEAGTAVYGDGSDGDVVLGAGTTTLTADMFYNDLTVPNGATLATGGFRVFVSGLLTVGATGVIDNSGGNASGGTAGAATTAGTTGASAAGATGVSNSSGQVGNAGSSSSPSVGGAGSAGGAAGGQAGGAGGAATAPTATLGGYRFAHAALGRAADGTLWRGGGGGGSGGTLNGNGTSGGGGGGGGTMVIWARQVDNAGTIRANGGTGGNATAGTSTSIGGGGGGGGGAIWLVHREAVSGSLGTVTANGGAGGTAAGTGSAGVAGSAGRVITLIA